ncbi:MAG: hypothetical protein V8Q22_01450 [Anaerostipes sp.]
MKRIQKACLTQTVIFSNHNGETTAYARKLIEEKEYKAVILSGDNEKIASILKLIYSRKQERAEQGKKLSSTDERYFKLAEYMLFSELSFVLNVPREHIEQYIADMIEA